MLHKKLRAALKPTGLMGLVLLTACATVMGSGGSSDPFHPNGSYSGYLTVDDQAFQGMLSLRTSRFGDVDGVLRVVSPVDIDGRARGRIVDGVLRLTVTYDGDGGCDGRIEGILDIARDGSAIDGPVTITDCGVPLAGRMRFNRE